MTVWQAGRFASSAIAPLSPAVGRSELRIGGKAESAPTTADDSLRPAFIAKEAGPDLK